MREAHPEALLAQVASEIQADGDLEVLEEASQVLVAEHARATLVGRLARARAIAVTMVDGATVTGAVSATGAGFVLLDDGTAMTLVRLAPVLWIEGLTRALGDAPAPALPEATWGQVVRSLADSPVDVVLAGGRVLRGLVAASGQDHLDLLVDGRIRTIALTAVTRLRQPRMDAWQRSPGSARTSG